LTTLLAVGACKSRSIKPWRFLRRFGDVMVDAITNSVPDDKGCR
jgi:hypothetical protein